MYILLFLVLSSQFYFINVEIPAYGTFDDQLRLVLLVKLASNVLSSNVCDLLLAAKRCSMYLSFYLFIVADFISICCGAILIVPTWP
jgi:hypothetical protein